MNSKSNYKRQCKCNQNGIKFQNALVVRVIYLHPTVVWGAAHGVVLDARLLARFSCFCEVRLRAPCCCPCQPCRSSLVNFFWPFSGNSWLEHWQEFHRDLEEDKRATTNVQNGLVFFFLFSATKTLILRENPEGKVLKNCGKVWKSVDKCENMPKRFCPLVVAL